MSCGTLNVSPTNRRKQKSTKSQSKLLMTILFCFIITDTHTFVNVHRNMYKSTMKYCSVYYIYTIYTYTIIQIIHIYNNIRLLRSILSTEKGIINSNGWGFRLQQGQDEREVVCIEIQHLLRYFSFLVVLFLLLLLFWNVLKRQSANNCFAKFSLPFV